MTDSTATLQRLHELLDATPDAGEGSAFHRRSDFLWQLENDLRRIDCGDVSILPEFEGDHTLASARQLCMQDAQRAVERWSSETVMVPAWFDQLGRMTSRQTEPKER